MSKPSQKRQEVNSSEEIMSRYQSPQWPEPIPESWTWSRVNWVSKEVRNTINPTSLEFEEVFHYSIPVIEETGDGRFEDPGKIKSKKLLLDGQEVLVSKLNPGKSRVITASSYSPATLASSEFIPLKVSEDRILSEYLEYVFKSEPSRQYLEGIATSATRSHQRVSPTEIRQLTFPLPPISTQRSILSFLENHITHIDLLIEKYERLLELLSEKRQAVINELLTRSESNNYVKLKYVVDFLPGYAFSSNDFSNDPNDIRLLRGINVGVGQIDWEDVVYWPVEKKKGYKDYLLESGDIVLGMDRPWISDGIRIAQISDSDCPALLVQRVLRIRAKPGVKQDYVRMTLEDDKFRQYFEPITTGVSVPHISQKQVGEFEIPLPAESEQVAILSEWMGFQEEERRLRNRIGSFINLLREKRQALITHAVTGQIDISEWEGLENQELSV